MEEEKREDVATTVRNVKRELHAMMNGPVSQSMRAKGLAYKVNFGVELTRLRTLATELPHSYALAAALWKEDVRECRLLAGMVMPPEAFGADLAELWLEQMRYTEEVDATVFHLLQNEPYAGQKAFEWIASERPLARYAGYQLLRRLFMRGMRLTSRDAGEFLDHAATDLHDTTQHAVRVAAYKTLLSYMEQGIPEERQGNKVLETLS